MLRQTVRGPVLVGHKEAHFVEVPWHPSDVWPGHGAVALDRTQDPRGGRGWPVTVSLRGITFPAVVGHRYGHSYLLLTQPVLDELGLGAGDDIELVVVPRDAE